MSDLVEKLKEITTNALKFWELCRVFYNVVLAGIVLGFLAFWILNGKQVDYLELGIASFVLAVLANLLYTVAYLPDLFVQLSAFREQWIRHRILLFLIGLALAALFAVLVCLGLGADFSALD